MKKKTTEIICGDKIELDCGYGPREKMEFCQVISIEKMTQDSMLFPDPTRMENLFFYVRDNCGNGFYTLDFPPNYSFDVIPKRI